MVDANIHQETRPIDRQGSISLADKLAQMKGIKIQKEKEEQNILLDSTSKNIKNLNQDIFKIDFVMSSMDGGPFAERIKSEPDNKLKNVQTMVDANKELLFSLGFSGEAKDLIDNPDFADTKEILEYKQAQKDKEAFESIDPLEIQKKFKELGIEIENPEEISHDIIAEKLKVKREELKEKISTEIENISKEIEPSLPELKNFDKREIIELYKNGKQFLSKDILKLTEKFGQDIIKEAVIKAYAIKAKKFIDKKYEEDIILKEQGIGVLGTVIDIEILKYQFSKTRDSYQGKLGDISYDGLVDQVKDRKNMVEKANEAIKYISNIEDAIPPQEIQLSMDYDGYIIKVPSFKEERNLFFSEKIKPLQELIKKTEKEMSNIYDRLTTDKFFLGIGKKNCEEEKKRLKSLKEKIQEELNKLWEKDLELKNKEEVNIRLPYYIDRIYRLMGDTLDKNVNSKDFFDELKKEADRIKEENTEPIPEELIELSKKYETLKQTIKRMDF